MAGSELKTPRERYREQMRADIKQCARDQIATAGASALSLNAIAKHLGMSGPALYRYYASRDDLITDLIRDAYRSLADAFRTARSAGAEIEGLAAALRAWALADPHRYLLIYGTPVPGYHAPADTTAISDEVMRVLLEVMPPARALTFWTRLHGVLSLELAGHFAGMDLDPATLFANELNSLVGD